MHRIKCDHLGTDVTGTVQTEFGPEPVYKCAHHLHNDVREVECVLCEHFYRAGIYTQSSGRHPHGVIVDRYNRSAGFADLYYGAHAFLFLGGPSVKQLDLHKLLRRGVLLISVNNCPSSLPEGVRPHLWLHTDPSGKFHDSIWRDPGVIKFTPVREWNSRWSDSDRGRKKGIRHRVDGQIVPRGKERAHDQPGVLGFARNTCFEPTTWLWEPEINRGNDQTSSTGHKDGKPKETRYGLGKGNGWPHTINTMFAALRLSFYLGIAHLYLVGADFYMTDEEPYAFDQGKSYGGVRSNNSAYVDMIQMFDLIVKQMTEAGFYVYNTNPESRLWTFPMIPFDEAIERATGDFEQTLNASGWYDD